MKVFLLVAHTGRGKSTYIKKLISEFPQMPKYIFDVQNEYKGAPNSEVENSFNIDEFINKASRKTGTMLIFEEATMFFDPKSINKTQSRVMKQILYSKRHTGNLIVLVFHTWADVPTFLIRSVDYFKIFYSQDIPADVKKKFKSHPTIYDNYLKVMEKTRGKSKNEPDYYFSIFVANSV